MKDFLIEHWVTLVIGLMAFVKVVVNLTPSIQDDKVFGLLDDIINSVIPNRRRPTDTDF
jgi:hypothetical protein